jgi:REDY-like protein HapK
MPHVFWLTKLRDGADRARYERFVRDVDYPRVKTYPNVTSYRVHRIRADAAGQRPVDFDYIEHFEVTSVEAYQRDREEAPGRDEFRRQLFSFLGTVAQIEVETLDEA